MERSLELKVKCDKQTEHRVLGALITLGNWYHIKIQESFILLDKDCFYYPNNKQFYLFLNDLHKNQLSFHFDQLESIVPENLKSTFLDIINDGYMSINYLDQDIINLKLLSLIRPQMNIIQNSLRLLNETNNPLDCQNIIADSIQGLAKLNVNRNFTICRNYKDEIEEILMKSSEPVNLNLNLETWPSLPAKGMITIAGRSGVGKTFLGLYLMDKIMEVLPEKTALYFNIEMQPEQMIERHAGLLSGYKSTLKETVRNAIPLLIEKDIFMVSKPLITIEEIEVIARAQSIKKPLGVIVIDYIGLIRTQNRYDRKDLEQGDIAQRLAALGLELNCIVLTLLQVNRNYKERSVGNRCAETTDAAESSGCERSSTLWLGIDQPQIDSDETQFKDLFIIKNRKSRGKEGYFTVYMDFKGGRFYERNQKTVLFSIPTKIDKYRAMKEKYMDADLGD